MTAIGELRHTITIETKTQTANASAGNDEVWSTFAANVWAKIEPKSGREILAADGVAHRVSHRITIRWRPTVKAFMRVDFQGRKMNIVGIIEEAENRRFTILDCEEGAPT